jgi:catechol 2,3-dioxygenase-like lactoylglutathione lyase family enzyme
MKLEVLFIPVSDVDRAKRFYEKLGFRLDIDIANNDFRGVQFTHPGSEASIIFGKGMTSAQPGSIDRPVLAVYDIDATRDNLIAHGVRGFPLCRRPVQQRRGEPTRRRTGPARSFLLLICFVRGSGRERLAAPGDSYASSRPRVELDATTDHGCSNLSRAPTRDCRAPRPL